MKELIVNADDFGISQEVNDAVLYCFQNNLINQTTLMVNMPFTEEAVEMAKLNGFDKNVGLHLNLVEGVPLTNGIKSTCLCENGEFNGSIMKIRKNRFCLDSKTKKSVSEEIEAQLKKYLSLSIGKKHIDSHQHSHTNPSIISILFPLLEKYRFESIRLTKNIPYKDMNGLKGLYKKAFNHRIVTFCAKNSVYKNVVNFGSIGDVSCSEQLIGLTEMMVHPIMRDGLLEDAFCNLFLEKWWQENNNSFELLQLD